MDAILSMSMASLLVGLAARVFIPWFAKRRKDPANAKWSWPFVWPQLLSFGILILLLPLLVKELDRIADVPAQAAWLIGWAAGDIGRKTYKALASESDEPGDEPDA